MKLGMKVPCPVCPAAAGERCRLGRFPLPFVHDNRVTLQVFGPGVAAINRAFGTRERSERRRGIGGSRPGRHR